MAGDPYLETVYLIVKFMPYILTSLLLIHIYIAIVFQTLAKKTNSKQSWLAWIPILNFVLLAHIAKMRWWPVLLLILFPLMATNRIYLQWTGLIAFSVFTIFTYIWFWKSLRRVNRPGWWVLFSFIPMIGWLVFLILVGVAAFTADYVTPQIAKIQTTQQKAVMQPKPQTVKPERTERMDKLKKALGQK